MGNNLGNRLKQVFECCFMLNISFPKAKHFRGNDALNKLLFPVFNRPGSVRAACWWSCAWEQVGFMACLSLCVCRCRKMSLLNLTTRSCLSSTTRFVEWWSERGEREERENTCMRPFFQKLCIYLDVSVSIFRLILIGTWRQTKPIWNLFVLSVSVSPCMCVHVCEPSFMNTN